VVDGVCGVSWLALPGQFYEFVPWNSEVQWDIQPWGRWQMQARNSELELELTATTDLPGTSTPHRQGTGIRLPRYMWGQVNWKRVRRGGKSQLIQKQFSMWLETGGGPGVV